MKKITSFFMLLLSITAFSQVEIIEDLETTANNQVPTGWTASGFAANGSFTCDGSVRSIYAPLLNDDQVSTLTSPNYVGISNGTELTASFSYNIFEQFSQFPPPQFVAPAEDWGSLELEYSTDSGATWTNIITIDDSNYTFSNVTTCSNTASISVGTIPSGSDFQVRFVATEQNTANFALIMVVDNISITQEANAVPNCDSVLTSPLPGSTDVEPDVQLTWSAATGLPTGYTISVGSTTGGTDIVNAMTTTEPTYYLSDLEYETEYFVNIVPFNAIGDATGCSETSFTTRVEPIPGATCSNPIAIASFPYITTDNTDNYEDNIDVSPCSNTYMNGKDVFYEITPSTDVSINIDMTGIDNNGPSIHVVEGCPDTATECIDYTGAYNSGGSLSLEDVVLFAGNTYFVVLSNSGSTRTYNYSLIITQNSCVSPEFTLTPVSDCGSGQFNVDVDVTYLGSATSLTLSDDDGATANETITATGIVTMGPYASGTTVNFSLTNDDDGSCVFNDSTFFYCPPTNDECDAPISLSINTDDTCTIFTSATNAGATHSDEVSATCGTSGTNDVWFSFEAVSESLIIEYLNITSAIGSGGILQSTEVFSGSCGSLMSLSCITGSNYAFVSGLTIGNTYFIRNYTNLSGYAQNYDICLKTPPAPPANDDCSNATDLMVSTDDLCDNQAEGTTSGATLSSESTCGEGYNDVWYVFNPTVSGIYEFSLEYTGTLTRYFIYEGTCGALVAKTSSCSTNSNQIFALDSTQSYYIMVRTSQGGPGVDFGLCVWQLPDAASNNDCSTPTTLLESTDETGNNMISGNMDNSYPSSENCTTSYNTIWYSFTPSATGIYHVDFTRQGGSAYYTMYSTNDCSTLSENYAPGFASCYNSGDMDADLVAENTYLISVHANSAAGFDLFIYPSESLSVESQLFDTFKFYPNPVVNTLTFEAKSTISNIDMYNLVGQQVKMVKPNSLKTTVNMNDLENGVYFVTVTIDNNQKTFKVIKK